MSFLRSMQISASGLTAQRLRMDVIAENLANVDTTRTENGGAYRRRYVVLEERAEDRRSFYSHLTRAAERVAGDGVRVSYVGEDQGPLKMMYDPSHPDANAEGYVELPNVDFTQEMVDMMSAYRAYEANLTAFNTYKDMALKALEIGK